MFIAGKQIEFFLYLEGVRIPINSVSISVQQGLPGQAQFNIPPLDTARRFMRGMAVHFFKSVNGDEPLLRFHGILTNVTYVKTSMMRSVILSAETPDCRWDALTFCYVDVRPFSSGFNSDYVTTPGYGSGGQQDTAHYQALASGTQAHATLSIISGKEIAQFIKSPQDADAIFKNVPPGDREKLKANITKLQADGKLIVTKEGEVTYAPGFTADAAMRDAFEGLSLQSQTLPVSGSDMFNRKFRQAGKTILDGLKEVLYECYDFSNGYTQFEANRTKILNGISIIQPEVTSPEFGTPFRLPSAGGTAVSKYDNIYSKGMDAVIKNIIDSSQGISPIRPIITNIMSMLFFIHSVDPLRILGGIVWHPMMLGFAPPRTNVIFPDQYNSLNYNPNLWANPTRSIVLFPTVQVDKTARARETAGTAQVMLQRAVLCDSLDPVLAQVIIPEQLTEAGKQKMIDNGYKADIVSQAKLNQSAKLTEEECWNGLMLNVRGITNEYFSTVDVKPAAIMANFLHYIDKYSIRKCSVQGGLIDDVIVGMPIVILDGKYSIHGILEGFNWSATPDGEVSSDLVIQCPRYVYSNTPDPSYPERYDDLPKPLAWIDADMMKPMNIGQKVYKEVYGCLALTDPVDPSTATATAVTVNTTDNSGAAKAIESAVTDLLKLYEMSANKLLFAEKYRERAEFTEKYVFGKILEAVPTSAQDSKETQIWSSKLFNPVNIGTANPAAPPVVVDRQKIVVDYLKEYYGQPGRLG